MDRSIQPFNIQPQNILGRIQLTPLLTAKGLHYPEHRSISIFRD